MPDAPLRMRDPVTFEVVRSALYATCEEMKSVMTRAAFSPLLSLSADLSCALLDARGEVVAQGNDIPVHLGSMPFTAAGILRKFPAEEWLPGDAVLMNDPFAGGNHLPDMTLMSAIFAGDGGGPGLVGFAASRVHWPDVGGVSPGSSAVTDHVIKEGVRVPPVRIMRGYRVEQGILDLLLANVRVPGDRMGDFSAQVACNARGAARVSELVARYGAATLAAVMRETLDYSEALVGEALAGLRDGTYRASALLDGDGYSQSADAAGRDAFRLAVAVEKVGRRLSVDFAGTSPAVRGPVNAPIAVTSSACYYVLLAVAGGHVPPNAGAYRPMRIRAPEGSLVHARYPSPVVAANTETSNRLADLLLAALAPALGDRAVAGSYGCGAVYTLAGIDPARGASFVHYETVGGGMGASSRGPGLGGFRVHMGNTMNLPIEAMEAQMPVRFEAYGLRPGSGGGGRHAGGEGVLKSIRALADGVEFSVTAERALQPAPGIAGGGAGAAARFSVARADGSIATLASKTPSARLDRGDVLVIETAGGGGWGIA
ncbi:MAG: hydantoinase B/oxoprolinase family protein [Alphaproteobacteria bacterium]|nr:hydantoinase B/oxoprolinase family protein [Alphaproteobacteria bacterium]